MKFTDSISKLKGAGVYLERKFNNLGIFTIEDLLYHIPERYIDYSLISPINKLQEGEIVTIKGKVERIKNTFIRGRRLTLQKATINDESGSINITWFNQPYLEAQLNGQEVSLSGKVVRFGKKLTLDSPEYEIGEKNIHTGGLIAVYPQTQGLSSKMIRSKIDYVLKYVEFPKESIPEEILKAENLIDIKTALTQTHQPENKKEARLARTRLAFDELFYLSLENTIRKQRWQKINTINKLHLKSNLQKILKFINALPFRLTNAQKKVTREILSDLSKEHPMNRLLQGDVGSGKTVVAAIAIYASFLDSKKSLFMAPTEILANQHFQTLNTILSPYGLKIGLMTGGFKSGKKEYDLIVGTHALLFNNNIGDNIALVVVDEQHRFGVEQRAHLRNLNPKPHYLTMTATPIPRTVALTIYGELDLSYIDEMPKGRKIIKTYVIGEDKFAKGYAWIKNKIKESKQKKEREQAFIIYPLIEESEILTELKSAKKEFLRLKREVFSNLSLGLLHGKLKTLEKDKVVRDFRVGKIDVLVSTTVIEVGMDIPNATIMVIENADRFGLAQLHQLRGRVGRNDKQSYCFLFNKTYSPRLKALEKYSQGIKLAEIDLKYRGQGDIFGIKQHGKYEFKIADISNIDLIELARKYSEDIVNEDKDLKNYPLLLEKIRNNLDREVSPD